VKFPKALAGISKMFGYICPILFLMGTILEIFPKLHNKDQWWKMAEARFLFYERRNDY